jgi:hypothetical protein
MQIRGLIWLTDIIEKIETKKINVPSYCLPGTWTKESEKQMKRNRTSISKATTYKEIGDFWDTHSLADYWDKTKPARFKVDVRSEVTYFPLEQGLSIEMLKIAKRQGIAAETLLNLWVQEKLKTDA